MYSWGSINLWDVWWQRVDAGALRYNPPRRWNPKDGKEYTHPGLSSGGISVQRRSQYPRGRYSWGSIQLLGRWWQRMDAGALRWGVNFPKTREIGSGGNECTHPGLNSNWFSVQRRWQYPRGRYSWGSIKFLGRCYQRVDTGALRWGVNFPKTREIGLEGR